jgi:hypothetical protein
MFRNNQAFAPNPQLTSLMIYSLLVFILSVVMLVMNFLTYSSRM